jgi:hypothetical protein
LLLQDLIKEDKAEYVKLIDSLLDMNLETEAPFLKLSYKIYMIKNPSLFSNILSWFNKHKRTILKVILCSSKNNGVNYNLLKKHQLNPVISKVNIEETELDINFFKKKLGNTEFKKHYDSYK